jgi:hypothetical protein
MSRHLLQGLCVAVDVHYLHSGRARAAAADAVFWQLLAEHIAMVSQVPPYPADRRPRAPRRTTNSPSR